MSEYIKRQKVFDSLPIVAEDKIVTLYGAVADFMVLVSAIPAADVVEVVRCWKCKHHQKTQDPCHGRTEHYCKKLKAEVPKDFFCGYGAKMDGE